jgi:beta-glucuronidase
MVKTGVIHRLTFPLVVAFLSTMSIMANQALFTHSRESVSLEGNWNIIIDPYENGYYNYRWEPYDQMNQPWATGYFGDIKPENPGDLIEYDYDKSPVLHVPGDWNTQDSTLFFYEGTVWYRKMFDAPSCKEKNRIFIHFGAVNYRADVYLNAKKIGTHIGGFTPFSYEITNLLRDKGNSIIVKVDNKRAKEGVPTLNTDWWNYGGITRDVRLVILPIAYICDYSIGLESASEKTIKGKIFLNGYNASEKVNIAIPELDLSTTSLIDERGIADFSLVGTKATLWSPMNPKLYRIEISTKTDRIIDSVGFRTITARGKQLLLNDEPIFLRGISIHEEYAVNGGGRVNEPSEAAQLLVWAKELGCNFVRLAHYPHNEDMIRIAEKMGIMVWSEIPVYWTIDWENEETYKNARNQLEENMLRDRNRACIIIWSLANETPVSDGRNQFLSKLVKHARSLDNTRLLSAAMEKHYESDSLAVVKDPLADLVDIVSFNEYIGWYDGLPNKCEHVKWVIPYDKPVFVSEFGGDAKFGYHGNINQRWTEEFQEDLYIKTLHMLDQIDGLCGMSPWILADFRSPRRPLPEIQDYFNRKGLYSEKGEKKKAFFILQSYYFLKKNEEDSLKR